MIQTEAGNNSMTEKQLAIDIHNGAVRFVKLNGSFVIDRYDYTFTDRQDYRYKQQLEEFLADSKLREIDFDNYSISWSGNQTTIVPANVFNESSKDAIFQLCFGKNGETSEIDYNRISEHGVVNVFSMPQWIKSFFVLRFPRIVVQHEGTHLLRGIFSGSTFKLKTILSLHDDFFTLVIVQQNQLQFYSTFEYSALDDIVYYLSFTLQQKEWHESSNEVVIAPGAGCAVDEQELTNAINKVLGIHASVSVDQDLIANYQRLCV